ncbi:MAG: methyltransferase, CheR-type [Gemmatimonadetes bacterium]|nr:methyltransferase, CheR-type [Gemmatimonadota bacterium]
MTVSALPPRSVKPMRSFGYTDPAFAQVAELAHVLAGLVFPPNRQPSAEAGMRRAMRSLRINDPERLLRAAESPGEAREAVLAELTIGESYFFRDSAQLALLATEILPVRTRDHGVGRPMRVWSAGCASGEEPYTIAIMLRELGHASSTLILGTDVAVPRLKAARRGRYTRWALRGVSEERVAKWFRRNGNYFDLEPSVRDSVEFRALNLMHDDYPCAQPGVAPYDVILCRNVMIYFDLPTVARIAKGLLDSLAPDGWLLLGASDPPLAHLVACEAVMTPAGVYYRRSDAARRPTPVFQWPAQVEKPAEWIDASNRITPSASLPRRPIDPAPAIPLSAPAALVADDEMVAAYERADYAAVESMAGLALSNEAADPSVARSPDLGLWILYIRAVANQGRLHDAGELCARALETHPLAAELHYLHATLLVEARWYADAAIAARRAIYLDRKLVVSHLLLGDTLTRTGDANGARIAFENVMTLLADVDPATLVEGADGVPAGRLRQIATLRLGNLNADASR